MFDHGGQLPGTIFLIMRQKWKNKRDMFAIVLNTLKQHESIWDQIPEFVSSVNALETKLTEFTNTAEDRLVDTTKVTERKMNLIDELHDKVYSVVGIIESYALKNNEEQLALEYSISKTSMIEGGAKATINRFSNVMKKATEIGTDLEGFGLTPQFLQDLIAEVDLAKQLIMAPRLAILQRKLMTKRLKQLLDEMNEIVYTHLTGIVKLLQYDHPQFSAAFMDARNVIDLKNGRKNESPPAPGFSNSD